MKILLLGSGGREHALAWRLIQDDVVEHLYALPGNDAIASLDKSSLVTGDPLEIANKLQPDLIVIGPEAPMEQGVTDILEDAGFKVFAPTKFAAQLETSKAFSKDFMLKNKIPTAKYFNCDDYDEALKIVKDWDVENKGIVIKSDALAAGKGVVVTNNRNEALKTIHDFMVSNECTVSTDKIVLEEKLEGREVSAFAICDGNNFQTIGYACDYKRIFDNDDGANTGGMGGYATPSWVDDNLKKFVDEQVFQKTIDGMQDLDQPYKGILYAGLMVSSDGTVNVIEFNVRFGDPEAQILMPLIDGNLAELFLDAASGNLNENKISIKKQNSVHIVMTSQGYPSIDGTAMLLNQELNIPDDLDGHLFIAGAKKQDDKWLNTGGRVLGLTVIANDIDEAREKAYSEINKINFNGAHFRTDIAKGVSS